ncbi:sensor histidine kinase KdpD [Bacteroides sp. 51]|uniref:sensor histidine kinase n=1 Tax=Bacteroides sp. 51 TaxID=2302938 RepID=UPI0013D02FE4|nr:HAMP domain-containing sensor histidine kinase [Bacteroides sp. 51]NDV82622.1 sensor histidine kinase [Bacteroides sp. 51]
MKLPIKYIAALVIISLTAIFAYQAHWLVDMYNTTKLQNHITIEKAIRNADYIELFLRVDSLSKVNEQEGKLSTNADSHGAISFSASFNKDKDEKTRKEERQKSRIKKTFSSNDSLVVDEEADFDPTAIGLPDGFDMYDGYQALEILALQLQTGLHSVVDLSVPIDIFRFDSILDKELNKSGLDIQHYTRVIQIKNDSTITESQIANVDTTQMQRYKHIYDAQEKYAFEVYIEPTDRIILKQMTGILATSLVILVVLGGAFWFLIRTIMQQKTLDEMKSDFTNNITHELKTPIAVAYAANDALLNFNLSEDKKLRDKYLNICQEQLQKLSGLVEQILSMSMERRKTFQIKPEKVEVSPLIHSLIEQHKLKAGKPVHIEVEIHPESLTVNTDRAHFSNIISNLIDNAVKYSTDEAQVKITCTSINGKLDVCVEDKGIGISPEKLKLVFDKFYRVPTGNRHDVKGYGLGLFYVKTMVEKMGGQIEVKSELGKGSRFRFTI